MLTLCANLCCCRLIAVGRMREGEFEYGDTEDRAVARDLEVNARCMTKGVIQNYTEGRPMN